MEHPNANAMNSRILYESKGFAGESPTGEMVNRLAAAGFPDDAQSKALAGSTFVKNADGFEGTAMMRRRSKPTEGILMFGCSITFVLGEAIARTLPVEVDHHPIARDLGDDRCRRDRQTLAVAFDDRFGEAGKPRRAVAIDESEQRHALECCDRLDHRRKSGLQDIVAIDHADIGHADADFSDTENDIVEFFALLGRELLRIIDAQRQGFGIEDHRGGDDRARPGSASGLIDSCDAGEAAHKGCTLEIEMRKIRIVKAHAASLAASALLRQLSECFKRSDLHNFVI